MDCFKEVVIISDSGSKEANCAMYDINSGTLMESYKEGHSVQNGLDFIGNDYVISAFKERPFVKVWQFGKTADNASCRMTVPGIVSAIAVSNCGSYCVAGIGNATYIWEVASGKLKSQLEYHNQDITCVRFTKDESYFLTGGKDGVVYVYSLSKVLVQQDFAADAPIPHYTWSDHVGEITDIYVGYLSVYSRVATASKDMTCRIYELEEGNHMCTISLNVALTSIAMDICEYFLFAGSQEGTISKINLFSMPKAEMHFEDIEKICTLDGHRKEITALCVSQSGKYLISGSADKECRIWDIANLICIKKLVFAGAVTNVITSYIPPGINNKKYSPCVVVRELKRVYDSRKDGWIETKITPQELSVYHAGAPDEFFDSRVLNCSSEKLEKMMAKGTMTFDDMSEINNEIFAFALTDYLEKERIRSDSESSS